MEIDDPRPYAQMAKELEGLEDDRGVAVKKNAIAQFIIIFYSMANELSEDIIQMTRVEAEEFIYSQYSHIEGRNQG